MYFCVESSIGAQDVVDPPPSPLSPHTSGGLFCWPFWSGGPDIGLTLCCFVVCPAWRFVLGLPLCYFVLEFFSSFSIAITLLGEDKASLNAFRTVV